MSAYSEKFASLIEAIENPHADSIMIAFPAVLGDTYEELIESMKRIGNAGKHIIICPQKCSCGEPSVHTNAEGVAQCKLCLLP